MTALTTAIAACLATHAQAKAQLGTDQPELDPRIDQTLRDKIVRQRTKVSASVESDPDLHRQHVEALTRGLKIVLRRLVPAKPKPPAPPMPVWDSTAKSWRILKAPSEGAPDPGQIDTPTGPNDRIDDLL